MSEMGLFTLYKIVIYHVSSNKQKIVQINKKYFKWTKNYSLNENNNSLSEQKK